ncbi:MAG TPA: hypothetical protein VMI75_32225 [Polyangiaceae bacterium]|nr:hypothetical protein [Polyangiaceae bacterium]
MSHTTRVKDDDGREWIITHNGDWSGPAIITRYEGDRAVDCVRLPGRIIREACSQAVARDAISILEQWDGSEEHAIRLQRTR